MAPRRDRNPRDDGAEASREKTRKILQMLREAGALDDTEEPLLESTAQIPAKAKAPFLSSLLRIRYAIAAWASLVDLPLFLVLLLRNKDMVTPEKDYHLKTSLADVTFFNCLRTTAAIVLVPLATKPPRTPLWVAVWTLVIFQVLLIAKAIVFDWSGGDASVENRYLLAASECSNLVLLVLFHRLLNVRRFLSDNLVMLTAYARSLPELKSSDEDLLGTISASSFVKLMKAYFWPSGLIPKLRCALTWTFLVSSKIAVLVAPIYMGRAIKALSENSTKVYLNLVIFSSLSLASKVCGELQQMVYLKVKQHAYTEIATTTFRHVHELSLEWHLQKKMGNVLRSMDRGVGAADTVMSYLVMYTVPTFVQACAIFFIFFSKYNVPELSAVGFLSLSAYTVATVQMTLWRKSFREKTNKQDNLFHERATDSLVNFETVKYFTAEEFEIERYKDSISKYQQYTVSTRYSLSLLNSSQQLIMQACVLASLYIAARHVLKEDHVFEIGDFVSVQLYVANLFAPLNFLGTVYSVVIQAVADMASLGELLAQRPDVKDSNNAIPLNLARDDSDFQGCSVNFRNVSFSYPTQPNASGIREVSFDVPAGKTTAIVGTTGAGKSTIFRLLFRFYDPDSGTVSVANRDVRGVTQKSLRKAIGVVPQDVAMFNDTIRYNIGYGKHGASDEEIIRACKRAKIWEFIERQPLGLDTPVGERGLRLSGGEKQRCAIARCLLKDPPIVVLDEATSALDSTTEESVQEALNELGKKRTVLSVAHRLSTVVNADQILVLEAGQIVERGSHAELLAKKGRYADMWRAQTTSR